MCSWMSSVLWDLHSPLQEPILPRHEQNGIAARGRGRFSLGCGIAWSQAKGKVP